MKKSSIVLFIASILVMVLLSCTSNSDSSGGSIEKEKPVVPGVSINPKDVTLPPSGDYLFTETVTGIIDTTVTWSILEGSPAGGTITQSGLYTAPLIPDDYHVVVTSNGDITKKDTAVVHVVTGATGNPYYVGTIDEKIQDTYTASDGTVYVFDDQLTFTIMLDLDPSFSSGFSPLDTKWNNYLKGHNVVDVSYTIYESYKPPKFKLHYMTSNGWHTVTPGSFPVYLFIWKSHDKYELTISAVGCPNCFDSTIGNISWYINAVDAQISPLPIGLTTLSGSYEDIYPGSSAKRVTSWYLKRTF
jgi:hypothetical protein